MKSEHLNEQAILADIAIMDGQIQMLEDAGYTQTAKSIRSDRAHLALLLEILNKETDNEGIADNSAEA